MNEFMQTTFAQILVFIGGPASLISIILGVKSIMKRTRREITYVIRSFELIRGGSDQIDGVSLTYRGERIDNLSVTKIVLWNCGNIAIRRNDIVLAKPITIYSEDSETILEVKIIYQSDESNLFRTINYASSQVQVDFEYVSRNDGLVLQVFHTGNNDSIKIAGKIIDGDLSESNKLERRIPRIEKLFSMSFGLKSTFVMAIAMFFIISVLLFLVNFQVISLEQLMDSLRFSNTKIDTLLTAMIFMIFSLIYLFFYLVRFHFGKKKCPKKLEKHIYVEDGFRLHKRYRSRFLK